MQQIVDKRISVLPQQKKMARKSDTPNVFAAVDVVKDLAGKGVELPDFSNIHADLTDKGLNLIGIGRAKVFFQ